MKICIIIGTRPEIVKMSSCIRFCEKNNISYFMIHTGQHYSYNMDKLFFEELNLTLPKYNLDVGSGTHGKQTGMMLEKIEEVLLKEKPDVVLVQGDTNSVLAGALAASKLHIKVGHVEAGLRSYWREMPEEINRVLTDHISDFLFTPTEKAKSNATNEAIESDKIFVTGNTIVDAITQNLEIAKKSTSPLYQLGIIKERYVLVTAHRQENVDDEEKLKGIFEGLKKVSEEFELPIIYPIHPRTKKMMDKFSIDLAKGIILIEPLGFLDFIQLEASAKIVLTDSGGIQEECCILKVPCVTLRENTERPETVEVGANVLVGTVPSKILEGCKKMLSVSRNWQNPFGDGTSGEQIIKICLDNLRAQ